MGTSGCRAVCAVVVWGHGSCGRRELACANGMEGLLGVGEGDKCMQVGWHARLACESAGVHSRKPFVRRKRNLGLGQRMGAS